MSTNNIHDTSDTHKETGKQSSRLRTLGTAAMMIAGVFSSDLAFSQTKDLKKKDTATELIKNIQSAPLPKDTISNDSIEYKDIIDYPIQWVVNRYGLEKAHEVIQQSILREVNKIRQENWAEAFVLEAHLTKAAQDYSEDMFKHKRFSHISKNWDTWITRAKKSWYSWDLKSIGEDIWWNYYCIAAGIKARKNSSIHFRAMVNPQQKYLWVWYCDSYRVLMFGH